MIYHFGREYNRKPRFAAGGGGETGYADERVPARKTNKHTVSVTALLHQDAAPDLAS